LTSSYTEVPSGTISSTNAPAEKFNFIKLATSGDVKLKITTDSINPVAKNVKVSTTATTKDVDLLDFRLKAEGSALTFNTFQFSVAAAGMTDASGIADEFKLMKGSQSLGSVTPVAGAAQTIKLDSDYTISQDSTDVFTLVAQVKKVGSTSASSTAFDQGDSLTATFTSVNVEDKNGDLVTGSNVTGSAIGNAQSFYSEGIQASGFSATYPTATPNNSGKITKQTYNISYKLKAFGNTYYIPKTAIQTALSGTSTGVAFDVLRGGSVVAASSTQYTVTLGSINSSANTVGNYFEIPDGEERTFTVSIDVNGVATTGVAGKYSIQLTSAGYLNSTSATSLSGTYTFAPSQDYRTAEYTVDQL
jgi:hypothetical protein